MSVSVQCSVHARAHWNNVMNQFKVSRSFTRTIIFNIILLLVWHEVFLCDICGIGCSTKSNLDRHINLHLPTVVKIKCSCGQKVSNKYNFTKHCERFHNNEIQEFTEVTESNIARRGIAIVSIVLLRDSVIMQKIDHFEVIALIKFIVKSMFEFKECSKNENEISAKMIL